MKNFIIKTIGIVALLLLAACGQSETDKPAVILFDTQRQALEQAKAVEKIQQERAEQLRRQMEEASK